MFVAALRRNTSSCWCALARSPGHTSSPIVFLFPDVQRVEVRARIRLTHRRDSVNRLRPVMRTGACHVLRGPSAMLEADFPVRLFGRSVSIDVVPAGQVVAIPIFVGRRLFQQASQRDLGSPGSCSGIYVTSSASRVCATRATRRMAS